MWGSVHMLVSFGLRKSPGNAPNLTLVEVQVQAEKPVKWDTSASSLNPAHLSKPSLSWWPSPDLDTVC